MDFGESQPPSSDVSNTFRPPLPIFTFPLGGHLNHSPRMGVTGGIGIEIGNLEPSKGRNGLKRNCTTFERLKVTGLKWEGRVQG